MATAIADDGLDLIFHALANRTRRALLRNLSEGAAKVSDLAAPFGMSLNAVSKHLLVLEDAGLLTRTVAGREHICTLNVGPMASVEQWLDFYAGYWNSKLDRFADFVEKDHK